MSGWSFNILTPKYTPWEAGTYTLRAGCWEIGLMCHLLNQFDNYRHLYKMKVAEETKQDALARLADGVEAVSKAKKNGIFARPGDITACLGSGSPSEERGKDPGNSSNASTGAANRTRTRSALPPRTADVPS